MIASQRRLAFRPRCWQADPEQACPSRPASRGAAREASRHAAIERIVKVSDARGCPFPPSVASRARRSAAAAGPPRSCRQRHELSTATSTCRRSASSGPRPQPHRPHAWRGRLLQGGEEDRFRLGFRSAHGSSPGGFGFRPHVTSCEKTTSAPHGIEIILEIPSAIGALALDRVVKPGTGIGPVPRCARPGKSQGGRCLFESEAGIHPQPDQLGIGRVHLGSRVKASSSARRRSSGCGVASPISFSSSGRRCRPPPCRTDRLRRAASIRIRRIASAAAAKK